MKFDELPSELVAKIFSSSDSITFHNVRELNKRTFKISTLKVFDNLRADKIILDDPNCYVGFPDGSRKLVANGDQNHCVEERKEWMQFRNQIKKVKTIELEGGKMTSSLTGLTFSMRFPNLKVIENMEFYGENLGSDGVIQFLVKYQVQNVKYESSDWILSLYFDDKTITSVNEICVENMYEDQHGITDMTLERICKERRKVFKLKNVKTGFTLRTLVSTTREAVAHDFAVDWNFGCIICSDFEERQHFDRRRVPPHIRDTESSLRFQAQLRALKSFVEEKGSTWTRKQENGYMTVMICKNNTNIKFSVHPRCHPDV